MSPIPIVCIFAASLLAAYGIEPVQTDGALASGWRQASTLLFNEANETFKRARQAEPSAERREIELGWAITLLGTQPRTQGNIARAREMLEKLMADNADDRVGLLAAFHLARMYELHLDNPDRRLARDLYLKVLENSQGDPLLEMAASRIALMDLYGADSPEKLNEQILALSPLVNKLTSMAGRREFHATMGITINELGGDPAVAFSYLQQAAETPSPLPQSRAAILLAAGALAEQTGHVEAARGYYSQFLEEFPRDIRHHTIEKRLTKLQPPAGT